VNNQICGMAILWNRASDRINHTFIDKVESFGGGLRPEDEWLMGNWILYESE